MSPLDWFKKQKPLLSMQSMGGGAAGLMISSSSEFSDATGGTKSTPGDGYIYHWFTSNGNLSISDGDAAMDVLIVGGGGGAGGTDSGSLYGETAYSGGGGGGGYVYAVFSES